MVHRLGGGVVLPLYETLHIACVCVYIYVYNIILLLKKIGPLDLYWGISGRGSGLCVVRGIKSGWTDFVPMAHLLAVPARHSEGVRGASIYRYLFT